MYTTLEEAVENLGLDFRPIMRYIMVKLESVVITETTRKRNIDFNFEEFTIGEPLYKTVRVIRDAKGNFHECKIGYGASMLIQKSRLKELINIGDGLYVYYTGTTHEATIVPNDLTYMYSDNKYLTIEKNWFILKCDSGLLTHLSKDNMINSFKFIN